MADPRLPRRSGRLKPPTTSSFLDLDAANDDSSSDDPDESIKQRLERLQLEALEVAKDAAFLDDNGEDEEEVVEDWVRLDGPSPPKPASPVMSARQRKRDLATNVMRKLLGSCSSSDDEGAPTRGRQPQSGASAESDESTDDDEWDEPSANAKKKKKKKKGRPKVPKRRETMALFKRVGNTNSGMPHPEFDIVRFGFYFARTGGDLGHEYFDRAVEWMRIEAECFSGGYERGTEEENLHGQFTGLCVFTSLSTLHAYCAAGKIRMPNTIAGCAACSKYFKECMGLVTYDPFKVQFKLLKEEQTDDKMNAYTRKDK
jgi:hypothetical protein